MPTLIDIPKIEDEAKLCKKLGLNFIELNLNLPTYLSENIDVESLIEIAREQDIYYTFHLASDFNPFDFNSAVASSFCDEMVRTIQFAKQLKVPIINMHLPKGKYLDVGCQKTYLYEEYSDIYYKRLKAFINACEKAVGSSNIKIAIENTDGYERFQKDSLELLLESEVFALALDIGNSFILREKDENFIFTNIDKLVHIHLSDAVNNKANLALGTGEVDLMRYLLIATKLEASIVLEIKDIPALERSITWIKKRLRDEYFSS